MSLVATSFPLILSLAFCKSLVLVHKLFLFQKFQLSFLSRLIIAAPLTLLTIQQYMLSKNFYKTGIDSTFFVELVLAFLVVYFLNAVYWVFELSTKSVISYTGFSGQNPVWEYIPFVLFLFVTIVGDVFHTIVSFWVKPFFWNFLEVDSFAQLFHFSLTEFSYLAVKLVAPYLLVVLLLRVFWAFWVIGSRSVQSLILPSSMTFLALLGVFYFSYEQNTFYLLETLNDIIYELEIHLGAR